MEAIIAIFLIFVGVEVANTPEEVVVAEPVAIEQPGDWYHKGRVIKSESGYYISSLVKEPAKAEGCDKPLLTADLSHSASESREVVEVEVGCEG